MSKQGHNAFYYFMLDFKEKQGNSYKSLKEVADAAGPHWKNLTKSQKSVYETKAKAFKSTKLNSDNKPVDEVELMERQEMQFKHQMRDEIQATLSIARRSNSLTTQLFLIVHFNSFCQHDQTKMYSPCEVAISAFSLKDGVTSSSVYHAMIKPGPLPLGYAAIAQIHSNETHQIDLPSIGDDVEDNQEEVFKEIIEFLTSQKQKNSERFPILYAAEKNLPMATSIIKMWCQMFDENDSYFRIYNLEVMFRVLRNVVADSECWNSDTMSFQEIEKDVYNYTPDIACDFHQMADAFVFCSRSITIRYAYIICDNCCKDANIDLIPGSHVPFNSMIVKTPYTEVKSRKSSKKSQASRPVSDGSVRVDSSDAESVISMSKSDWGGTTSSESINFPELSLKNVHAASTSRQSTKAFYDGLPSQDGSNHMDSYAGATSLKTGSSGFSRRPPALPLSVTDEFCSMTISQESMDNHFPAIGVARGRGSLVRGRGRGNPFKKPNSAL